MAINIVSFDPLPRAVRPAQEARIQQAIKVVHEGARMKKKLTFGAPLKVTLTLVEVTSIFEPYPRT